jgi:N-acetylneuraminate epimerase
MPMAWSRRPASLARNNISAQRRLVIRSLPILCLTTFACAGEPLTWKALPPLPDKLGVAGAFAGESGGALLVAGGANFPGPMPWEGGKKVWHDAVWVLDRPDGMWREAGKLPQLLGYGVSVTHRGSVVCVGGSDAEQHHAEAFRLVWKDGKLGVEPLPALPIRLSGAAGTLVGETLYIACGAEEPGEQAATNRAFALDFAAAAPQWRELPPLPGKPRILAAGAAQGEHFYVLGGAALVKQADGKVMRAYLPEAWSYRAGEGWRRLADLPRPSVAAASPAPVVEGRILVIAGDDGSRVGFQPVDKHPGFPGTVLAYDTAHDRWSEAGTAPAPRATLPCAPWLGAFVLPSGEVRPGVRSPEVWSLHPR